jgi:small GTP-binding protein
LQIWDTAGQERFRSLIPNYLKDAKCALIVIDVTNLNSMNNIEEWMKLYSDNRTSEGFTFLIGNKIDL